LTIALLLSPQNEGSVVSIHGCGKSICKAVSVVEIAKRKLPFLKQVITIHSAKLEETWQSKGSSEMYVSCNHPVSETPHADVYIPWFAVM
jgi:DNA-binding protein